MSSVSHVVLPDQYQVWQPRDSRPVMDYNKKDANIFFLDPRKTLKTSEINTDHILLDLNKS